jgi:type I restriction enzyme R subunit
MPAEHEARAEIDKLLSLAGWRVANVENADIHANRGVAIREFPLKTGHGFADYLLYVDGKACGVIEAKKQGTTLTGVEIQSSRYAQGLPTTLPAWRRPLPFLYESTGVETHFTNGLDPDPRARNVFAFHKPDTLAEWLSALPQATVLTSETNASGNHAEFAPATFLARVRHLPPLAGELWPPKPQAIANIEKSLGENRPRALVQMATGSGKTLLAIVLAYRLTKFAGARRVLFLVDRGGATDNQTW